MVGPSRIYNFNVLQVFVPKNLLHSDGDFQSILPTPNLIRDNISLEMYSKIFWEVVHHRVFQEPKSS